MRNIALAILSFLRAAWALVRLRLKRGLSYKREHRPDRQQRHKSDSEIAEAEF